MASVVEICNMALGNIRSAGINSLTEPSVQAQQCKLRYATVRDVVLASAPWGFNKTVTSLAQLSAVTVFNWQYVYQHPQDCLYIDRIIPNYEYFSSAALQSQLSRLGTNPPDLTKSVPYERHIVNGNRVIVTNEPLARIQYRARIDDPNVYDPAAIEAIAWLLSAEVAIPIVGGEAGRVLRSDALQMYKSFINSAAADNQNQMRKTQVESEFVTARQ